MEEQNTVRITTGIPCMEALQGGLSGGPYRPALQADPAYATYRGALQRQPASIDCRGALTRGWFKIPSGMPQADHGVFVRM